MTSLPGFKTLLAGDSGDGKTHAIRTLQAAGIQPIVQATEPGMRALAPCDNPNCDVCRPTRALAPIPWSYIAPTSGDVGILIEQAKLINTRDQKFLCNINDTLRNKTYDQFTQLLTNIQDFKDAEGKSWGPVTKWGTDRAYVLDGLTSVGTMAMDLFCGRRPLYDKPDYLIAQRAVLNLMTLLTCQMRCHVVVIAHIENGEDAMGRTKGTIMTVGRKLAPDLPRLFDDMPIAYRRADKFYWSTALPGMTSKGRNLPIKDEQVPDFRTIVESWKKAGGKVEPTVL